jgi:hypothetical protein
LPPPPISREEERADSLFIFYYPFFEKMK